MNLHDIHQSFSLIIEKRIKMIKENPQYREKILFEQKQAINFNEKEFCSNFVDILSGKNSLFYHIDEKEMEKQTNKIKCYGNKFIFKK